MSIIPANSTDTTSLAAAMPIDQEAILKAFNINPRDPKAQAMILACEKYGLDPLLKHAVLISGNLYVTRDGLLHVAHRSGRLDGIVVEDEGQDAQEWWAKVTVYVKGQTHGYTYRGRYPKSGQQKKYGPEMAVKVAEVMALRRAFGVTGIATVEEQWDKADDYSAIYANQSSGGGDARPPVVASPSVPAPDREAPGVTAPVESAASDGEVGSAPAGGAHAPGGKNATGGEGSGTGNGRTDATVAAPTSSGGCTLDDLDAALPTPKWNRNKVLREARRIATEEIGLEKPPTEFDDLAKPEYAPILTRMCELVGATPGQPKALTDKQRGFMHAVWAKHGGDDARKAAISRLTSGRTDSSSELTADEVSALMDLTAELDKEAAA